jgi:hypothetical protein
MAAMAGVEGDRARPAACRRAAPLLHHAIKIALVSCLCAFAATARADLRLERGVTRRDVSSAHSDPSGGLRDGADGGAAAVGDHRSQPVRLRRVRPAGGRDREGVCLLQLLFARGGPRHPQHPSIERFRILFERLLSEFPLCFGYWTKWANYEGSLGAMAGASAALPCAWAVRGAWVKLNVRRAQAHPRRSWRCLRRP